MVNLGARCGGVAAGYARAGRQPPRPALDWAVRRPGVNWTNAHGGQKLGYGSRAIDHQPFGDAFDHGRAVSATMKLNSSRTALPSWSVTLSMRSENAYSAAVISASVRNRRYTMIEDRESLWSV